MTKAFYAPYMKTSYLQKTGISVHDVWGLFAVEPEYFYHAQNNIPAGQVEALSLISVASLMNNITGLIDQTKAAIFVISVQNN